MSLAGASESSEIAFPQLQLCRRRYGLPLAEIPIDDQEGKYRKSYSQSKLRQTGEVGLSSISPRNLRSARYLFELLLHVCSCPDEESGTSELKIDRTAPWGFATPQAHTSLHQPLTTQELPTRYGNQTIKLLGSIGYKVERTWQQSHVL
jgi:hypothetical protein